MNVRTLLLAAALFAAPVLAAPPTDEQVADALKAFNEKVATAPKTDRTAATKLRYEAGAELLNKFVIADLTTPQMETLKDAGVLVAAPTKRGEIASRLVALSQDTSSLGARAAVMRLDFLSLPARDATEEKRTEVKKANFDALALAANHPGLMAALKEGKCGTIFQQVSLADKSMLGGSAVLTGIERIMTDELPAEQVAGLGNLVQTLSDDAVKIDPAARERIRATSSRLIGAAVKTNADKHDEKLAKRLESAQQYVNGAFARGTLLNHAAPDLAFKWSSSASPITRLSDLKGKVVVVDFWATWCGPCIGSFPHVREMQARYKDSPVVILGITSIQGFHMDYSDPAKAQKIDTKSDPAKEMSLMPAFMKQKEMTWTVAFSEADVFNPDFGVRGIPHVAIIDPAGVVRFRGLHPTINAAEEIKDIDALLAEFKLPVPTEKHEEAKPEKAGG